MKGNVNALSVSSLSARSPAGSSATTTLYVPSDTTENAMFVTPRHALVLIRPSAQLQFVTTPPVASCTSAATWWAFAATVPKFA